jgi:multicomponent K+:H+ antiporter subunit F
MIETALQICVAAVAVSMLLCTWRLWRGPSAPDRILAIDTLYINVVALVILLGLTWQTALLFEARPHRGHAGVCFHRGPGPLHHPR